MTTTITAVDTETAIEHGTLIDVVLDGVTYYVSNTRFTVTYNGHDYTPLAGFLAVSEIQNNISNSNSDIQISLSGIPTDTFNAVNLLNIQIKGGSINVYRAFFNINQHNVITSPLEVYPRFKGSIVNFSAQEDINLNSNGGDINHVITIIASSIMGVLENRYAGRRTNKKDYQRAWSERYITSGITTDPSMSRVEALHNSSFDFGKPYVAPTSNSTGSGITTEPVTPVFQGY
jgi:hypothetical protein